MKVGPEAGPEVPVLPYDIPSKAKISDTRQGLAKVEIWDTDPCIAQLNCWPGLIQTISFAS